MALHTLNEIRNLNDPLRQFQVKFTISECPAMKLAKLQQKTSDALTSWMSDNRGENKSTVHAETLELRCTSFTYPGTKLGQSSTTIAGFRRKLGTIQNKSGVWACKITEDQNGGVLNIIQSWCDLIHNPMVGTRIPSSYYVSSCVVEFLPALKDMKDNQNITRNIWLKGFYPIEYTVGQIDASSSAPVEIEVKFNYDWWTETATSISALSLT